MPRTSPPAILLALVIVMGEASLASCDIDNSSTALAALPASDDSIVNISFVKEVTLSVRPVDLAKQLVEHPDVTDSFLSTGLRFFDPIMSFFEQLFAPIPVSHPPSRRVLQA